MAYLQITQDPLNASEYKIQEVHGMYSHQKVDNGVPGTAHIGDQIYVSLNGFRGAADWVRYIESLAAALDVTSGKYCVPLSSQIDSNGMISLVVRETHRTGPLLFKHIYPMKIIVQEDRFHVEFGVSVYRDYPRSAQTGCILS